MAEEEKKESQSGVEQASDAVKEKEQTNWEQMYKAQQEEVTKANERANKAEEMLDVVSPHVDWNAISGQGTAKEQTGTDEENYASKKDVNKSVRSASDDVNIKLMSLQFRIDHPELKEYERTLVGPAIVDMRRRYPRESNQEILDRAAKYANEFLTKERAKGATEAEKKLKDKQAEEDAAAGLGSAGSTAPESQQGGQTNEGYLAERKERLAKAKGLV